MNDRSGTAKLSACEQPKPEHHAKRLIWAKGPVSQPGQNGKEDSERGELQGFKWFLLRPDTSRDSCVGFLGYTCP